MKHELQEKLGKVYPAITNGASLFHFYNQKVHVLNDELGICLSYPFEWDIEGSIKAVEMYKFINNTKNDSIRIKTSKQNLELKTRTSSALLSKSNIPIDIPDIKENIKWNSFDSSLIDKIKYVSSVCLTKTNFNQPALNCVHIKDNIIEATDTFQIKQITLDKSFPDDILIPQYIIKYLDNFSLYFKSDNYLYFSNGEGLLLSCKLLVTSFPKTQPIIQKALEGKDYNLPDDFIDIFELAWTFAKREKSIEEIIFLSFDKNKLTIESKSFENSIFKEELEIENDNLLNLALTPSIFKETFKNTNTIKITAKLLSSKFNDCIHIGMLKDYF